MQAFSNDSIIKVKGEKFKQQTLKQDYAKSLWKKLGNVEK